VLSGTLTAVADFASASVGDLAYSPWRLALSLFTFSLAFLLPLGVVSALWLTTIFRWASRSRGDTSLGQGRKWAFASLAGLPLLLGVWWVPLSWLRENADALSAQEKGVAGAAYLVMLLAVLLASRIAWWCHDLHRASPHRTPLVNLPVLVVASLFGAACYWADRSMLVGLYEDFHYGLSGGFLLGVVVFVVAVLARLRRLRLELVQRFTWPRSASVAGFSGLALACGAVQLSSSSFTPPENALLFAKGTRLLSRHSDLDGDGYSSWFGGLDCAPFDRFAGPAQVDLPNNGKDEDCTGSDATWPAPRPPVTYPIPRAKGMNLLLITVDTLRADRTTVFGNRRNTTPHLKRLAEQGLAFSRAYAQGTKTFESVPSLMTGLYPSNLPRDYESRRARGGKPYLFTLTEEGRTFTQLFQANDYQTKAVTSLGYLYVLGLDRGFQKMERSRDVTSKGRSYLREAKSPFFLWLHYLEPHSPYQKHPRFDFGDSPLDRYDSEVAHVDALIGRVLRELEELKLDQNTVVVVTSDHGEEFREHGGQHHGIKLHQEVLHVPLIVKVPGLPAARVDEPVELTDVAPSLCEAFALSPRCDQYDGQSLWATAAGQRDQRPGFRGAYAESYMSGGSLQRRSLRSDGYRLNLSLDIQAVELFDLKQDPRELRSIAHAEPAIAQRMREEMALRPHRRLATAFAALANGDSRPLVQALPLVQTEPLLRLSIDAIAKQPSDGSASALRAVKSRPRLSDELRERLEALSAAPAR
jgi:arylsulfatase A-like enzyme